MRSDDANALHAAAWEERVVAFHVHTNRSFDSLTPPAELIRVCLERGVHTLCVTDHDTIDGSFAARDAARDSALQVIIGAEYATDLGDVIGLFLREDIRPRDALGVVEAIHGQGGVAILPHPFHAHPDVPALHEAVDAIEVFNGRCSLAQNQTAFALAKRIAKPMVAGSDAHFAREVVNATMRFRGGDALTPNDLLTRPRHWAGRSGSPALIRASQGIKGLKMRSVRLAVHASLATIKHAGRAAMGLSGRYSVEGEWSATPGIFAELEP